MKKNNAIKRDNLLVDFIKAHKGYENSVTKKDISQYLTSKGFKTNEEYVHNLINKIIFERNLPICSLNSKGWYWAKTKKDILITIEHLKSRIFNIQKHIEHLENFIIE